jgi:ABC-type oligopeptide transport system substrate-binding subunit
MANFTLSRSAGILAAMLMLVGAVGTMTPAVAEKVLRVANMGEPETLDPHKTSTTVEHRVLLNLFDCVAGVVSKTWRRCHFCTYV